METKVKKPFERIKYPDGQISVKWDGPAYVTEKHRINSYEDLIFVKSLAELIMRGNGELHTLFIPCLFGQRSDKRFTENQSFDLKIICDIINSCGFSRVEVFDPHSDVALALINNSRRVSPDRYIADSIVDIKLRGSKDEDIILVSPDAGAYKKVFKLGDQLGYATVAAVKDRDLDGTVKVVFTGEVKDKNCLIIDDLCDGGATFISLSAILKLQGARKVYLYISHAYFSKGLKELRRNIDHIYCTNSVKDLPDMWQVGGMETENVSDFVTQFKII